MTLRQDEKFIIDDLTVSLMAHIPDLAQEVLTSLSGDVDFMQELGSHTTSDGTRITIKMWTPNKIIHDLIFENSARLGDLVFSMDGDLPLGIRTSMLNQDCSKILGHPMFSQYQWEGFFNESETMIRIDLESDISLGNNLNEAAWALEGLITEKSQQMYLNVL